MTCIPRNVDRLAGAVVLALLLGALLAPQPLAAETKPPSLEDFAMWPKVYDVDLSPDGKRLAVMRLRQGQGDNYVIDVYETAHLDREPHTLGAERMNIVGFSWANDERLLIRTRQPVEIPGRIVAYRTVGFGAPGKVKTYAFKLLSVGIEPGSKFIELPRKSRITRFSSETFQDRLGSPALLHRLPKEEDWVLIQWDRDQGSGSELLKINVKNGRVEPVFKISGSYAGYVTDPQGEVRIRSRVNSGEDTFTAQFRLKGSDQWRDWITWDVNDRRPFSVLGFYKEGSNQDLVLVRWSIDRDTAGIYLFDLRRLDEEPELLFATERYDAGNVLSWCVSQACHDGDAPAPLVGFTYEADGPRRYMISETADALLQSIDAALPPDTWNSIIDRADDDKYMVIRSQGPREPGRYYLLTDRTQIQFLGASTDIAAGQLGERRAIWYEARDGVKIHAILTLPTRGKAPYPLVMHPHGGPAARDGLQYVNSPFWDEWPQVLATRGYAVLQPNFRGSTGYGREHYLAGDGEWGYKMQDDVDDGALHLVKEGIAHRERMAIFGWSYGGYSAMAATQREPNLYRCSIPGAGVSSLALIQKGRARFREVLQAPSKGGHSPINHMDEVNIPVLLVHGGRDDFVPIKHSDLFAAELEKRGKPYKYVKLADAAHTINTIDYEDYLVFYRAMLEFLADDCGMGGLPG